MTAYVECHGTGTPAGDPLEIAAIGRVFAKDRSSQNPLLVGSVSEKCLPAFLSSYPMIQIKSNIGHTESASGIAGIMKTVLALENGVVPPTVGFQTLNPQGRNLQEHSRLNLTDSANAVDLKGGRLKIVTENTPWPCLPIRRASVSFFSSSIDCECVIIFRSTLLAMEAPTRTSSWMPLALSSKTTTQ